MNTIEGHWFAALTNLASSLKTFRRIAAQQPEVEALCRALTNEPAAISAVLPRALALAAIRPETEREAEGGCSTGDLSMAVEQPPAR
jgi:hypothetical protein